MHAAYRSRTVIQSRTRRCARVTGAWRPLPSCPPDGARPTFPPAARTRRASPQSSRVSSTCRQAEHFPRLVHGDGGAVDRHASNPHCGSVKLVRAATLTFKTDSAEWRGLWLFRMGRVGVRAMPYADQPGTLTLAVAAEVPLTQL